MANYYATTRSNDFKVKESRGIQGMGKAPLP